MEQPFCGRGHSPRTIALCGGEAEAEARRLLAEAISPTSYDFSLLKELPLKVYVLPPEGPEYVLKQGGIREVQAELDVHDYEADRGELVTDVTHVGC